MNGGGGSLPLKHDWIGNGLLALPHGVDFALVIHPFTSVVVKASVENVRGTS